MGQYDVLVLILILSVIYDLQFDKVPNALIGIGITAGVIFRLSSSKGTETWILVFDYIQFIKEKRRVLINPLHAQIKHALSLLNENSYSEVERMTGISKSTLIRAKKMV